MKRRFRSLVLTPQLYAEVIQSSERKRLEGSAGEVDALAENRVGGVNEQQRRGAAGTNRVGQGNLGQARIKGERCGTQSIGAADNISIEKVVEDGYVDCQG